VVEPAGTPAEHKSHRRQEKRRGAGKSKPRRNPEEARLAEKIRETST